MYKKYQNNGKRPWVSVRILSPIMEFTIHESAFPNVSYSYILHVIVSRATIVRLLSLCRVLQLMTRSNSKVRYDPPLFLDKTTNQKTCSAKILVWKTSLRGTKLLDRASSVLELRTGFYNFESLRYYTALSKNNIENHGTYADDRDLCTTLPWGWVDVWKPKCVSSSQGKRWQRLSIRKIPYDYGDSSTHDFSDMPCQEVIVVNWDNPLTFFVLFAFEYFQDTITQESVQRPRAGSMQSTNQTDPAGELLKRIQMPKKIDF